MLMDRIQYTVKPFAQLPSCPYSVGSAEESKRMRIKLSKDALICVFKAKYFTVSGNDSSLYFKEFMNSIQRMYTTESVFLDSNPKPGPIQFCTVIKSFSMAPESCWCRV